MWRGLLVLLFLVAGCAPLPPTPQDLGTFYRWEAEPGQRLIEGYAGHMGRISFPTEPGRLYFVQQRVSAFMRFGQSYFALIPEPHGRAAVRRAELVGGR